MINNCLAKWRLGAWDIQELPLLAASSQMETAPMAGKSRQPSHEPPRGGRKQAPITLKKKKNNNNNSGKKGRDRGGETASKEFPRSGKRWRSENAD